MSEKRKIIDETDFDSMENRRYTNTLIMEYAKRAGMTDFIREFEKFTNYQKIDLAGITLEKVFKYHKKHESKDTEENDIKVRYSEDVKFCCALIVDYCREIGMNDFARVLERKIDCQNIELKGTALKNIYEYHQRHSENRKDNNDNRQKFNLKPIYNNDVKFGCALIADYCTIIGMSEFARDLERKIGFRQSDTNGMTLVELVTMNKNTIKDVICNKVTIKDVNSNNNKVEMPKKRNIKVETHQAAKKAKVEATEVDSEELSRLVPIRTIFEEKISQIEESERSFPDTELAKVAKYILDENVKVKNSIAITVGINGHNQGQYYSFLQKRQISRKGYGPLSEENLLNNQWNVLVQKVPIFVPEKFIKDIHKSRNIWIQRLFGAYLSQAIVHHNSAGFLYSSFIRTKLSKGRYTPEEDEKLLEFDKAHNGNATPEDWNNFALQMDRMADSLRPRLCYLKGNQFNQSSNYERWTLAEDKQILEYINEHFDITNADSLKTIKGKDFYPLAKPMKKGQVSVARRGRYSLIPILLGNIYNASNIQWKYELFKYIIENKVKSISELNWSFVLERWPFLVKEKITQVVKTARYAVNVKGYLFEQISERVKSPIKSESEIAKSLLERKEKIIQIHDALMEAKTKNVAKD